MVKINGIYKQLINYSLPLGPYMILETLDMEDIIYNGLYILSFNRTKTIKIGRNNNNDIAIKDISVSREHAEIRLTNSGTSLLYNFRILTYGLP